MRRTKIVCTIGPASEDKEILATMMKQGMDLARLNFSHGNYEEHGKRIENIRQVAKDNDKLLAILLDTRGPEIRIKKFKTGKTHLKEGQDFILSVNDIEGDNRGVSVTYLDMAKDISVGGYILLDDSLLKLEVKEINGADIICEVLVGGELSDSKGINVPNTTINLPPLSEKDINDIKFGINMDIDFIAASFIRKAEDVIEIKKLLEDNDSKIQIVAKIENQEGVDNIDSILQVADGVMVARGDLGVEIPTEEVPLVQKYIIEKCNKVGKPVITATQMLDSMARNPRPTRAEASDVANAIFDGTDGIMLSGETAVGKYPVETVATMSRIAERAEKALQYKSILENFDSSQETTVTGAISFSTCHIASKLKAKAIITSTNSGFTARMVSRHKPKSKIIAVTPNETVARQLCLSWGVYPVISTPMNSTDEMFESAIASSLDAGLIKQGQLVVITAGIPVGVSGTTNLLRVHTVGDVIIKGVGIGRSYITGKVCLINSKDDLNKVAGGEIMVFPFTDREHMPYLEKAAGIITERGGVTSHAAVVGLNLEIPVIVGAEGALETLIDGEIVTLDSSSGLIYRGKATI